MRRLYVGIYSLGRKCVQTELFADNRLANNEHVHDTVGGSDDQQQQGLYNMRKMSDQRHRYQYQHTKVCEIRRIQANFVAVFYKSAITAVRRYGCFARNLKMPIIEFKIPAEMCRNYLKMKLEDTDQVYNTRGC